MMGVKKVFYREGGGVLVWGGEGTVVALVRQVWWPPYSG